MNDPVQGMHPDLRRRVLAVWRQCRRTRWTRLWMRFGLATFLLTALTTGLLAVAEPTAEGGAILAVVYLCGLGIAAWHWLIVPLRNPITVEQVAMLIDEQHPELENRVASAVEFTQKHPEGSSNWLINQLLKETTPLVRETNLDALLDEDAPWFKGIAAAILLLISFGTIFAFNQVWFPTFQQGLPQTAARIVSLPFTVEPGDVRVRRGDNQMVWVQSDKPNLKMTLRWRNPEGDWLVNELDQSATDNVYYHQFANIQDDIDYEVHYEGKRSETFTIAVWSPPEVDAIDLTYNYPEYLEREPREVPNSGNITGVEGTQVDLDVWVNKKLAKAEMVLDSGDRIPLKSESDMLWGTEIELTRDDKYRIELTDLNEAASEYNHEYKITVQRDNPPDIRIKFPRGDSEVTMLEEIPFDFTVSDDHGFAGFGLQYEVSGQEPVRLALNEGEGVQTSAEGHHEIRLEELGLEPGDFITWTVWAEDEKPDRRDFEVLGDPFFLEIRPFQMRYEEAISGGGQAGMQGDMQRDPVMVMKDIIIATWNLRKDAYWLVNEEFEEKRAIIVDELTKLKEAMSGAMGLGTADLESLSLNEALRESLDLMRDAEMPEPEETLTEAMAAEQRAYRMILKMKPREAQVQQQMGQQGGGGGGGQQRDIDALEMERNKNFYEEENVTQQEQEAVEKVLNRIDELAQRQQLINEEIEKLISEMQNEEDREELQRRLERLKEELEENLQRMDETRQQLASQGLSNEQVRETQEQLRDAREQLNRSLDQLNQEELQEARASGSRAMDSLGNIEEFLQQFSRAAAAQRLKELQEKFEDLKERQDDIAQRAEEMQEQHANPSLDTQEQSKENVESLLEEKERLKDDFAEVMSEGGELAERSSESQELMSRNLNDWLRDTSREGIYEDIEDAMNLVKFGVWDAASQEEQNIARKFEEAAEKLGDVADSLVEDDIQGLQKALENLDELMGGAENRLARRPGEQGQEPGTEGQVPLGLRPEDEQSGEEQQGGAAGQQGEQPGEETEEQQGVGGGEPSEEGERRGPGQGEEQEQTEARVPGQGDQESQEGRMRGEQPGEEQGEQGRQGQQGEQPGQEQGQQPGQQGQRPGEQGERGQSPEGGQGQGGQPGPEQGLRQQPQPPGQDPQAGPNQGNLQSQPGAGGSPWGATGPGGAWDGSWDWVPQDMDQFVNQDYSEWLDRLRNAESLLPEDSEFRRDLTRLREEIETMRRAWRERQKKPQFDLFLEMVANPLVETADDIQREIERRLNEKEFILADEGDIPERYRERVADYFKELSEWETSR